MSVQNGVTVTAMVSKVPPELFMDAFNLPTGTFRVQHPKLFTESEWAALETSQAFELQFHRALVQRWIQLAPQNAL